MKESRYHNDTVVITGAGGGLGAACARSLAEAGWKRFLLCDIDHGQLSHIADALRASGATVRTFAEDISSDTFVPQLLEKLENTPVGALIHTAGLSPAMAEPERILNVNLGATIRLVEGIRSRMAPESAVVLFASNSSYFPLPAEALEAFSKPIMPDDVSTLMPFTPDSAMAYMLSKYGVRALVKREAKSFGERGARIVSVSPGAIATRMTEGDAAEMAQHMATSSASGRLGRPEELAAVVSFLCSPAASFVTAVDWLVDGGHTAGLGY